jgi:hypothetical protein
MLPHRSSCVAATFLGKPASSRYDYRCYSCTIQLSIRVAGGRVLRRIALFRSGSLQRTLRSGLDRILEEMVSSYRTRA